MTEKHKVAILFESSIVHIENFQCPEIVSEQDDEECATHHEIVFPRAGTFVRYDSSGSIVADMNQILFFHQNQPYEISHPASGGDVSTIIRLAPDVLFELLLHFDPAVEARPNRPFPSGHVLVEMYQRILLHQILLSITYSDPLEIEERVIMFLASVIRNAVSRCDDLPRRTRPDTVQSRAELINHTKLILNTRFREKIKLHQIADAVHSSAYHLCRVFRHESGLSMHRYLQRIRLLNALEQLAEHPKANLASVALNYGFNSHSHFSTAFVNAFGITPSEFCGSATCRNIVELRNILKV
jgi:AraC-like DNA-binding protein